MNQHPVNALSLQKAILFFKQPAWTRLTEALYKKYIEYGRIGGQVVLQQCTSEEQREIARFLGRPLPSATDLSVRLTDFQQALTKSSFACDLPILLLALFPERSHVTKQQQKEQQVLFQQQFSEDLSLLIESLPLGSIGRSWLVNGNHGRDALFRQHKNESREMQKQLLQVLQLIVSALDWLPPSPSFQSLSHFAFDISGDPHFFDANTANGRLFLSALADLHDLEVSEKVVRRSEKEMLNLETYPAEQDHWRHLLYYEAGLLVDTVSSTVAVFHLKYAQEQSGQTDALITHAGERVLVLPLRQLLGWKKILPSSKRIYVFENPQVFEVIIDELLKLYNMLGNSKQEILPTLVCTSGWPSVASIRFLNLLTQSSPDVQLYYSGDFDMQGLRIARYFLARYPQQCLLWRFDPFSYLTALHHREVILEANEVTSLLNLPEVFSALVKEMQQERKKAYQEGITPLLLEDIRSAL